MRSWSASRVRRFFLGLALLVYGSEDARTQSPVAVTLTPTASPSAAQPGVTSVSVTGSNFPSGTINASDVSVNFQPTAAGPPSGTAAASAIATVVGTTRHVTFVVPSTISVTSPTPYLVSISGKTTTGTTFASSNSASLTVNPGPGISVVTPASGYLGQTLTVTVTGTLTNFVQGSTKLSFGAGISVGGAAAGALGPVTVTSATSATAQLAISPSASTGALTVTAQTGTQQATKNGGFTVTLPAAPHITDFNPKSAAPGALITVTGNNLVPSPNMTPTVALNQQSGGTTAATVVGANAGSIGFVIPANAATGPFTVSIAGQNAVSPTSLTITSGAVFTLSASPAAVTLIQGQSTALAAQLGSPSGTFSGLAQLNVSGLPPGVTAVFKPSNITAGQTSVLTLSAPSTQTIGSSSLMVTASATVNGVPLSQSATAQLMIAAPTTTLLGRTVVSDATETPLTGVTITMRGQDGNGATTGCTGSAVSDAAGNFTLANLGAACVGRQLVGFDGTTASAPPGKYAGVNLAFVLTGGQVTSSPVLVHLPRIDNAETFYVQQNFGTDQSYSFQTIPGLAVTAYAHTTFTMPDGSQPNPFPLTAVSVPVDRLPDLKPPVPTMLSVFIVAFQPANVTASQPVPVYFPNTLNTPPGTDMALMTLDPTHGVMVPYGTATVSNDGTDIIPDMDPAFAGHRFGLVHFDWHMVGVQPGNQANPCPNGAPCVCRCHPVDLASGLEVINETDISFGGARGTISIIRTYRSGANQPLATEYGPFGYGTNHNWGYQLDTGSPSTASVINLIMPDGNRYAFSKQADGTFVNSGIPLMGGAVMTVNGGNTSLRWKDGTTFGFIVISGSSFSQSFLDSVTDANGNRFQIIHNGTQIQAIVDPTTLRSLLFNYNNKGEITKILAPDGTSVNYDYQGEGPVLRQVIRTDYSVVQYSYDNNNGLTSETDNTGNVFASNTYDSNQRVIQQRVGDGGVWNFSYTLQNPLAGLLSPVLATTVTDPLGKQTIYRFSPNGAVIGVTDALGQMRTIDRDGGNYIVGYHGPGVCPECGDPTAGDQTFSYDDSTGNLLSQTDALGNTTTFTYEPVFNKVISIKDSLGGNTRFQYDAHGNLLSQTDPNGNATSFAYDQFGELIQTTDATNQTTSFAYDVYGNLVSVQDALRNITMLQYDANGRVRATTDALGRETLLTYDGSNRVTTQTNAKGGMTRFAYDTRGNLLSVTNPLGVKTLFTYDLMDRLLTRQDGIGRTDTRTYDFDSNLVTFVDRRGQTSTFTYDTINRLTGELYQDGSAVARSYDANSRLANANDSTGGIFAFTYDAAGRLTGSTTPFGGINYTRDNLGRATTRQVLGQAAVTYSYDPTGNLLSASTTAAGITRTYDARNLLATATRMNGVSSQYTYDQLGRLASLTHTGPAGPLNLQTYAYDAVGNRSSGTNSAAQPLVTQTAPPTSYDGANEQVGLEPTPNSFDGNGNLVSLNTSGSITAYSWDSRNRLISVSAPGGQTTSFTYDFAGNLIQQKDVGPTTNVTQAFLLDSLTNVAYVNRSDGDAYSVLAGRSIDDHVAVVHFSGQIEYGLADGVNSTVVTADQTGAIKGRFTYEPFGQTTASNSSYPFQYTGRFPVSSSLYYYRARFYNSQTGRFISEDPLGFGGGDINLYRYVTNSPITYIDPLGFWKIVYGGGFHLPISAGTAVGPNISSSGLMRNPTTIEAVYGEIFDFGSSVGYMRESVCAADYSINFDLGPFGFKNTGIQLTPQSDFSIFNPGSWNPAGLSFGVGLGYGLPVSVTAPLK